MTVDSLAVLFCFDIFVEQGVDPKILEKTLGMTRLDLVGRDKRIQIQKHHDMMIKGIEASSPSMALKIGSLYRPEYMGVVGHVISHCNNLELAIMQLMRYFSLFSTVAAWNLDKTGNDAVFEYIVNVPAFYNRIFVENYLAAAITIMRLLTKTDFSPIAVTFKYDEPDYLEEYKEIFKAPLRFNQKKDSLIISRKQLALPIPTSQPYARDVFINHASALMEELKQDDTRGKVKKLIMEGLYTGNIDIEKISFQMNMSRWTLNRKLVQEGITYQALLKMVRKELAMIYLKKPDLSITEVAFLLGYSATSAFDRAFKNWFGVPPNDYRFNIS